MPLWPLRPSPWRKITKSPDCAPSGTRTISAGGVTSNRSPGFLSKGIITETSMPSARLNSILVPGAAQGGTSMRYSGMGPSRYVIVSPGWAAGGEGTSMRPCGPHIRILSPGMWFEGSVATSSTGGVAKASSSWCCWPLSLRPPSPGPAQRSESTAVLPRDRTKPVVTLSSSSSSGWLDSMRSKTMPLLYSMLFAISMPLHGANSSSRSNSTMATATSASSERRRKLPGRGATNADANRT
mmetsp:Transcript_106366/g.295952  ORF Transcript_106366/g.295952 Transcript_106366/m.295952 type:complete len:240 (+) Transcript_106366:217-936(+)